MDSPRLKTLCGFTRQEWFYAYLFDQTDEEALASVNRLFVMHAEDGSDDLIFAHRDLLRLAYVSEECRAKVLALIGADRPGNGLLEKLRFMDREDRSGGKLRRWPASDPL
jgi:hypothetical protein